MKRLALHIAACVAAACVAAAGAGAQPAAATAELRPAASFAAIADRDQRAAALFTEAGKVLQHPRCVNCHPGADRPLQGDRMALHQPVVTRGMANHGAVGMQCATCHGAKNFELSTSLSVPGHADWHVAPRSMAWQGKSLADICTQVKDPRRNGGKSMAQLVDHMARDSLVGWAWQPGAGRTPAPGTQQAFGELIRAWAEAGGACPR